MKSEKGITLIILIIYLIIFTIVITILANMSNYIYSNLKYVNEDSVDISEFNKFNAYFIKDVKDNNDAEIKQIDNGVQITFKNGNVYRYFSNEKTIYKNKQKIAKDIQSFTVQRLENGNKKYLQVYIDIGSNVEAKYTKTLNYVLRYW